MKLLSPFSSRPPHRPNHNRHKTGPDVRPARGSTTIQRKPHQQTPETLSARPEFVPSMSPGTTSEEECAGSCFQTQADVHNECTCHSVTDVSQLNPLAVGPCTQHDNTSSINLESSSAIVARGVLCKISQEQTTKAMNTDLQKRTPGQLPRYCATYVETIESNASVTESRHPDVVAQDSCETPPPEPYRGEPEFISRSTQYTQGRGMDSSHATVTDDCLRLQEEIGNMPYDISYDMHFDKVDVETQPSYTDDICRTHSSIQHKSDFILTQNDSGVLEDSSSPSVRIIDHSEDSTSDLDDTDGGTGSSLCCAIAETHDDSSGNSCHDTSVAETVQVKTAVVEDCCTAATHEAAITADVTESEHANKIESESDVKVGNQDDVIHEVTHQTVITANAESEHASKTEGENDVEGRNHDDLKHEATITVVAESEHVEAEKENRNMSVESELRSDSENDFEGGNQDDVKHEATHQAAITVDVESEHASKTEGENDVEGRNHDDLKHEATITVVAESEHVEAEKENRNMSVESELRSDSENDFEGGNQDDVKHEATHQAAITVDVESEHASKTENENDVEVRKHDATLEDTITVVVETESEHVEAEKENRNMSVESELRSDSENDFEGGNQDDVKHEATHQAAITVDVESEHASKTENEHDVEVRKHDATLEATFTVSVETESEYVEAEKENRNMNVESELRSDSENDFEGGNQDDVKHEATHQAAITVDVESEHASKTENENDVEVRKHDATLKDTITVVVETESEHVEAEKENRNMSVESELRSDSENDFEGGNQDDVKHEATHQAAITVDVESEHASKTENEHDVEVRKHDATLEATFTVSVETESEHVEAEKENRNMNVESELRSDSENDFEGGNQDDVKHEATHQAAITVDVESEHASKTENENDVEVRKHDATLEDTITVVVETESEHVEAEKENRNMSVESELRSDSENDFEGGNQDDVKHEATHQAAITVDVESEHASKTEDEHDVEVRKHDATLEATFTVSVETESEHVEAEKENRNMNVESELRSDSENDFEGGNQDDVKHEATHQAAITVDVESEHASKTENENDVEVRKHDATLEDTITVVVETESEHVEAEKENRNMSVESELRSDSENDFEGGNQDDVKHEATHQAAITVDVESEHASKTEDEHDVEVRKHDATLEATFTVSVETESEHVEAEKENRNMNVESELRSDSENDFEGGNQDDVKHEATHQAAITVDVESEHASKTENEHDVEVRKHDVTLEATFIVSVETESEHVEAEKKNTNMNVESELGSDNENYFECRQRDDVKHKSTTTIDAKTKTDGEINVKTESEHIKLKTAHDIAMDDQGKIAKTESKDAVVKVVEAVVLEECESYVKSEIHKEADNVEDICTKCGSEETDGHSSGSRNYGMGDTCHLGDCDKCPSEMPHNDDNLTSTERSDMRHPEVSHGDSKCAVVDQSDRLHQRMLHSNSDTELSHGDSDNTCVGKAETCHPCELHGDIVNTLTETDDMQDLDSLNSSDTVPHSDVVSLPGVQCDRPSEEMVNVDLYVQTNCDLMLLLLMEDGVTSHEETVTDVVCASSSPLVPCGVDGHIT